MVDDNPANRLSAASDHGVSWADEEEETEMPEGDESEERDEVKEVNALALWDTRKVRCGRYSVTAALMLTAVAVTIATYTFQKEQNNNFEMAYQQFSRTLSTAAVQQQRVSRRAYTALSSQVTAYSQSVNATWPFFSLPNFESYGQSFRDLGGYEIVALYNMVDREQMDQYMDWANRNYEAMVEEAHLYRSGNLDRLNKTGYHPFITKAVGPGVFEPDDDRDFHLANWNYSPPPLNYGLLNWNTASLPDVGDLVAALLKLRTEVLVLDVRPYISTGITFTKEEHEAMHSYLATSRADFPHSFMFAPIFENLNGSDSDIVGVMGAAFAWDFSLRNLLPRGVKSIHAVLENSCDQMYTYSIEGPDAYYIGEGDIHERSFNKYAVEVDLALHTHPNYTMTPGHCMYKMTLYPTSEFKASYDSDKPKQFAMIVFGTFVVFAVVFFLYDVSVERRNEKLVLNAAKSNAVVTSLFPSTMRDRILADKSVDKKNNKQGKKLDNSILQENSSPIADLFLESTIMFGDLVGFTAWSSEREPSQVFVLLEAVYGSFDAIAKQRRVFKVETVGDCYVAAAGVPEPRKDHPVLMCRFARDCLFQMDTVARSLESVLGPGTGELTMRIGLHSGPVTGGVLRGDRSRFQLFGDTMNTASRHESTGAPGRIQISQQTADLLVDAHKGHWFVPREQKVKAKGKGEIQTFWLQVANMNFKGDDEHTSGETMSAYSDETSQNEFDQRTMSLIKWNADYLEKLVLRMISKRSDRKECFSSEKPEAGDCMSLASGELTFPSSEFFQDQERASLSDDVRNQLVDLVTCIASMHRKNPFHSFERTSHVVMSVGRLLSEVDERIETHEDVEDVDSSDSIRAIRKTRSMKARPSVHGKSPHLSSDPMVVFAAAFSALISALDHSGLPNPQLLKENSPAANVYRTSVNEYNALDLSWNLLQDDRFVELRQTLFAEDAEVKRFRDLVTRCVLATDLTDKSALGKRDDRWARAFDPSECAATKSLLDQQATLVLEHVMQVSVSAWAMQHWAVFLKWNEKLFHQRYINFSMGKEEGHPKEFWKMKVIGALDNMVIPSAKRLRDCSAFGV